MLLTVSYTATNIKYHGMYGKVFNKTLMLYLSIVLKKIVTAIKQWTSATWQKYYSSTNQ